MLNLMLLYLFGVWVLSDQIEAFRRAVVVSYISFVLRWTDCNIIITRVYSITA